MPAAPPSGTTQPTQTERTQLLDASGVSTALRQMADQIVAAQVPDGVKQLALIGIYTRGVEVARRLCDLIEEGTGQRPASGVLDVSMHRDDLRRRPRLTSIQPTRLPVDLDSRTVVLVDDVFFTGRTIRAALDALGEYGRAPRIQLAVLIDRGHRELPIRPDYTGKIVSTEIGDRVQLHFAPDDGETDAAWLTRYSPPSS